ncbi:hypothetical protein B0T26DRAFT_722493 [Lasiosphaeria miniovina]|uniref:Uncharacterized protein n=1 Tax=Lasiosphaeria miniovina TaxID=1954250 RepID=A0AA40A5M9_9PEZI|nr:uncharacterized protein B0T26DRAFT_722493 [Lasiosphaeria miniovina]KAK0709675.1 hypothetical protein B0T26DRAFT_722493 [Lasiosphaeria miniovina]
MMPWLGNPPALFLPRGLSGFLPSMFFLAHPANPYKFSRSDAGPQVEAKTALVAPAGFPLFQQQANGPATACSCFA